MKANESLLWKETVVCWNLANCVTINMSNVAGFILSFQELRIKKKSVALSRFIQQCDYVIYFQKPGCRIVTSSLHLHVFTEQLVYSEIEDKDSSEIHNRCDEKKVKREEIKGLEMNLSWF